MTPRDNVEHAKQMIQESETLFEALEKIGLDPRSNYAWIRDIADKHGVKNKPFGM